jgi:hypothetical protein
MMLKLLGLYGIIFSSIIAVGYMLIRTLRSVRKGTRKSGSLAGLAVAMSVLFGVFRDSTPQDEKKITSTTSKKGSVGNE